MKQIIVVLLLVFGGLLAWFLAARLSSDALGMAVGLLFGVLAGVPTALLVMASQRQRRPYGDDDDMPRGRLPAQPYQPPVIVLAAPKGEQPAQETHYHYHAWPFAGPPPVEWTTQQRGEIVRGQAPPAQQGRVFKVVGEREEWGDDW